MSEEKVGIKETKELLVALTSLTFLTIKNYKETKNLLPSIVSALSSEGMGAKLEAAIVGITSVVEEIKDLDFQEALELAAAEIEVLKG